MSAEIIEAVEVVKTAKNVESETLLKTDMRSLTADFNLTLHTASAQAIFEGEWSPGKTGLRQFGRYVQILWEAFEKEDPYAEWQLLKVYEAIQALKTKMQEQEKLLRKQTLSLRGIYIKPFRNGNPITVSMVSVNILVLMAANLITQTDYLSRQILTLKQLGLVPVIQMRVQELCDEIQKVFMLAQEWEQSDITRQEILDHTKKAQRLEKKFGKLPEDILHQKIVLPFLFMEE
jgi:integrating conjugative element protein (TIGR03761 family)